jgi:isoquinoline 1-oxidoreductase beta subunit
VARAQGHHGYILHKSSARRIPYGELVDAAARLPAPQDVALKEPKMFKLIGTPRRRLDTPIKVNGSATFGIDVLIPRMKFAVVAISPTFGGALIEVDEVKAKAVAGVSQVVRMSDAVAVVGAHTWAAIQGLAVANPRWDAGPNAWLSTADVVNQLAAACQKPGAVARREGEAARILESATRKMQAVYEQPFLAHAALEPMNCTVHVQPNGCDLWVGTQVAGTARNAVARVTGLKPEQVRIHNHLLRAATRGRRHRARGPGRKPRGRALAVRVALRSWSNRHCDREILSPHRVGVRPPSARNMSELLSTHRVHRLLHLRRRHVSHVSGY